MSTPTTEAQAVADPCAAPWNVITGAERPDGGHKGGFYVVKFNRCTGDAMIFGADDMDVSGDSWYNPGVKEGK